MARKKSLAFWNQIVSADEIRAALAASGITEEDAFAGGYGSEAVRPRRRRDNFLDEPPLVALIARDLYYRRWGVVP